jgi:hypothetical protein
MTKLTALGLKRMTKPGRYSDGGNLWLQVRDAEHRSWLFRYTLHGRARQMGLGPFPDVSLAEAREKAQEFRKLLRDRIDPIQRRHDELAARAAEAGAHTFRQVADMYLEAHERAWRNPKHRAQWRSTLAGCGNSAVRIGHDLIRCWGWRRVVQCAVRIGRRGRCSAM